MEIVSDQLRYTEELSDTIILHSNAEKGGSIHLYILQGGRESFAGLRMDHHALEPGRQFASCKRAYARVQMTFPDAEGNTQLLYSYFHYVDNVQQEKSSRKCCGFVSSSGLKR